MDKHSLIRTIYLYLFALLGLVLLTIGSVRFVDMGLKTFVFTKADDQQRYYEEPMLAPYSFQRVEKLSQDEELTDQEKEQIKVWIADYNEAKEKKENIDPVVARRHKDASFNLAMILIGLPLYLFHWRIIRKETKNKA